MMAFAGTCYLIGTVLSVCGLHVFGSMFFFVGIFVQFFMISSTWGQPERQRSQNTTYYGGDQRHVHYHNHTHEAPQIRNIVHAEEHSHGAYRVRKITQWNGK